MRSKNKIVVLIAAIGILCQGCAFETTEENSLSEVNEESVGSENVNEVNSDGKVSYDQYSGNWTTEGISYHDVIYQGGTAFSVTIQGSALQGSIYSVQGITQQIAEINDIVGTIENGVCLFEFQDDGRGDSGTLYIEFLEDRIEIEVEDFELADSNLTGFAISGIYTLYRAADVDADTVKSETESGLDDTAVSDVGKTYRLEEYGTVEEKQQEYLADGTGNMSYYYKMEKFFFSDTLSNAVQVNHTLQQIYDEYEEDYIEEAKMHEYEVDEVVNTPYSYWHILSLEYIGEDYVSILYNDVYYMGGAHPYSRFDGITIDCKTGEQISASQLLEKSDEEILTEISNAMGFDFIGTWDDVDFYLTDSTIVFFYRMPGFWEDVILQRNIAAIE